MALGKEHFTVSGHAMETDSKAIAHYGLGAFAVDAIPAILAPATFRGVFGEVRNRVSGLGSLLTGVVENALTFIVAYYLLKSGRRLFTAIGFGLLGGMGGDAAQGLLDRIRGNQAGATQPALPPASTPTGARPTNYLPAREDLVPALADLTVNALMQLDAISADDAPAWRERVRVGMSQGYDEYLSARG